MASILILAWLFTANFLIVVGGLTIATRLQYVLRKSTGLPLTNWKIQLPALVVVIFLCLLPSFVLWMFTMDVTLGRAELSFLRSLSVYTWWISGFGGIFLSLRLHREQLTFIWAEQNP